MCNKCDKQFNYKILHSLYCNKHKLDKIIKTLIIIVDKQQKEINSLILDMGVAKSTYKLNEPT